MFKFIFLIFLLFINNSFSMNTKVKTYNSTKIKSNEILIKNKNNLIIFTGNVEAIQDNLHIFADKMYIKYKQSLNGDLEIQNIKLFKNVVLKNDNITVRGDKGFYDFKNNIINIEDNIIMNENDAVIFGNKLVYNTITQETNIYGKNSENKDIKNERITIILDNINNLKDRYDN